MERMLKNLRKKTYPQLWIVVAFMALFVLAHQGAYADMMDSGGQQEPAFSVPSTSYADTYDAGASVDFGAYSYDNYSYDSAPADTAPNYVVDWNDSGATSDWNVANPTNTYSGPVDCPDNWSMVGNEWSYTAPSDTNSYGSSVVDFGSTFDPTPSYSDYIESGNYTYGPVSEAGYNNTVSSTVLPPQAIYGDMSNLYNTPAEISASLQALDGYLNPVSSQPQVNAPSLDLPLVAGNAVYEPGVLQPQRTLPIAESVDMGIDTSWADVPATYGEYGEFIPGGYATLDGGFWDGGNTVIESVPDGLGERGAVVMIAGPFVTVTETPANDLSSVGVQPDFGDTPATYGEYGEIFDNGYATLDGGFWDGGNTIVQDVSKYDPHGVQGPSFNPGAADTYDTSASHVVQDTSLSDDPSHYLGTYGRNFTPDDFQVDSGYTTSGDFIGPPAPVDTAAAAAIVSAIHIEKKGGILEFIGGVAGGIAEHTLGAAGDIGKGVYKAGADHVYGPLIGTGNGDNFKPGVLTNAVGGVGDLASGAIEGTGQLFLGKEGDDSNKGLIGGGVDLVGKTGRWTADHTYGTLIGTGNGDNFKPGVLTNAVDGTVNGTGQLLFGKEGDDSSKGLIGGGIDLTARTAEWIYEDAIAPTGEAIGNAIEWGYDDVAKPVAGHVVGVPIDIGKGVYKAGADHVYGPLIGTGNGDNFKPGVLTNAVDGTVNGTGQLLFGKEGDDSSKGLIGGGIDLTARTAEWIYEDAIAPTGEAIGNAIEWGYDDVAKPVAGHVVGVPIDIGKGVYKAGADHVYGPLIGTGNGDNFKPGVLTNAVDWGYNDLIEPVGGHVVGAAGDIGEGFYNAGKDHIIEPIFK